MRQILSLFLLLLMPVTVLADGMVVPTVAYPAHVTIPDQRALICFSNGVERLVIETRFVGSGTNFAWVVPLPSQPVIEEATTGLFPTLEYLFRPQIIHNVPSYYVGIFALIWLAYVLLFVRPTGRLNRLDVTACALLSVIILVRFALGSNIEFSNWWNFIIGSLFIFFDFMCIVVLVRFWESFGVLAKSVLIFFLSIQLLAILLPTLAAAKRKAMESVSRTQAVSILDRKIVGIFETTTIVSHDAKALQTWLSENGYSVPTNSGPVIANYVKDGWVFVAAKVQRENAAATTNTPQPLSFTFKTDRPVYPMRLTGLNNKALNVALYVFGAERATAPHFNIERCTRPNYPAIQPDYPFFLNWRRWSPETPDIVHPLLRKWANGLPVATKLVGRLSPTEMRRDVWIQWSAFSERQNRLFSPAGAWTTAANWGSGIFAVGLAAIGLFTFVTETLKARLPRLMGIVALAGLVVAGSVYLCLPRMEVRLAKVPFGEMENTLGFLSIGLSIEVTNQTSLADARLTAAEIINGKWSREIGWQNWRNDYLGGPLREEDSPGNYTLRETDRQLQLVSYDAEGGAHIWPVGQ